MDETDRLKTAATLETVRTGVPSTWRNPDTGNEYVVTPTKTLETASGPCRKYTHGSARAHGASATYIGGGSFSNSQ